MKWDIYKKLTDRELQYYNENYKVDIAASNKTIINGLAGLSFFLGALTFLIIRLSEVEGLTQYVLLNFVEAIYNMMMSIAVIAISIIILVCVAEPVLNLITGDMWLKKLKLENRE